ncbi:phosphate signaling complex protein PhoU [Murdochiella massiliensis]|uniref:phosphate signaling complex protein PhoU n=1 Tax=Murdochiella massiliensis TaxID=1673723 RepID=UPI000834A6D9|nr:phosphate signaling complex protein PhoU [Murdochiella massiliensis]MBY0584490.1 phosphate signaling complex protein PhoU [Murdochiella sp. Marseille-P8839]
MRNNFVNKLEELNANLVEMGEMVNQSLSYALGALISKDKEQIDYVLQQEEKINHFSSEIEQQALLLLLKEQPLARDFRFISAAIRMNTDLERIGDQAEDIAVLVKQMLTFGYQEANLGSLTKMSEITQTMVSDAVRAFVEGDSALAYHAAEMDDEVDALFMKVREEIIAEIRAETIEANLVIDLLMISKYLERSADHAQNIAEAVVYSITGAMEKFN